MADKKIVENAVGEMQKIAGQKPVITKSRNRSSGFKIRDGYPSARWSRCATADVRIPRSPGHIALPRVRDFRGVSAKAFDGRGNYNMGVKEQIIFPEIEYDKVDALAGMNISITTTAKTDEEARRCSRRSGSRSAERAEK